MTPILSKAKIPPGPKLPKIVAGYIVMLNHMRALRWLQRRYGDAFKVQIPFMGPTIVLSRPDYIKQMFLGKPDVLIAGDNNLGKTLGPGSLFSLDRDEHLRERRLLLPPFHGERMRSYEVIIEEEARREMATWRDGAQFATLPSFMRITLHAILRAVFGAIGPNGQKLADLIPRLVEVGSLVTLLPILKKDLGPRSPGGRFNRYRADYDRIINAMIDDAVADPQRKERVDVMALLLRAKYDDGSTMSRSAIADELLTLLVAGHETTATSLAWTVERLTRNPSIVARLKKEAMTDEKDLRLATINEVQRTRPVIHAVDRLVTADEFPLGEWRIPRGYRLLACATLIHNDKRFFERPEVFDPDRFLVRAPDTYTWIPFGGGTRRCIGAAFAQMEMNVVLRTLLREFDLEITARPGEAIRSRGVALAPAQGGRAVVRRPRRTIPSPGLDAGIP